MRATLAISVLVAVGVAACGATGTLAHRAGSSTQGGSSTASVGVPTRVGFGTGSVGPANPASTPPTDLENPIPSGFGAGQNILITAGGFEPRVIEANVSSPVVWTNETDRPQRIIFDNFPVDSGTIPPGGTFTWSTSDALTLTYRSSSGRRGTLAMNPVDG